MTDLRYDFLDNDFFTIYQPAEEPVILKLALQDNPLNLSYEYPGLFSAVTLNGDVVANDMITPKLIDNNNSEYLTSIQQLQPTLPKQSTYQQSVPTNYKTSLNSKDQKMALQLMNGLVARNIEPHLAAGIIGNLYIESGFNSSVTTNDLGEVGGALAGWRGENLSKLKNFAKERNKPWTNIDVLLDYLVSTIPDDVMNKLKAATNASEASEAWAYYEKYAGFNYNLSSARKFLKSKNWSDEKTMNWINENHANRSRLAEDVFNLWLSQKH